MREDIIGGLRNALEKGASLEEAIKSFTNAGYPEAEVREAATAVQSSGLAMTALPQVPKKIVIPLVNLGQQNVPFVKQQPIAPQKPVMQQPQQLPQTNVTQSRPKRKLHWLAIILVSILLLLVGILILTVLFQDSIVLFLKRNF